MASKRKATRSRARFTKASKAGADTGLEPWRDGDGNEVVDTFGNTILVPRGFSASVQYLAQTTGTGAAKAHSSALDHIRDELVKHRLLGAQLRGRLSDICGAVFGASAWMAQERDVSEPTPNGIIPLICAESDDLADTLRDIESLVEQLEGL